MKSLLLENHKFLKSNWRIRMRATVDDIHHRHWQSICRNTTNITIQGNPNSFAAALATAKETPKMAFAPKFDLFEYHLNQSSSDQFDFVQNTLQVLSDNRIYILHRIQNSFS
jgi:hypothetical protein